MKGNHAGICQRVLPGGEGVLHQYPNYDVTTCPMDDPKPGGGGWRPDTTILEPGMDRHLVNHHGGLHGVCHPWQHHGDLGDRASSRHADTHQHVPV